MKSTKFLNFFCKKISSRPRFCIFITLLSIPLLLVIPITPLLGGGGEECRSGRIYSYNLPPTLNSDLLLHRCPDLDPDNWECGIATNHGLGRPAAELRGLLPDHLAGAWYRTSQYALEPIFHHRLLRHRCRTADPQAAAAFYIPFYAGMAAGKYLYANDTALLDRHADAMLRWVQNQSHWRTSNGADHFTAVGRTTWEFRQLTNSDPTWGSSLLNKPEMKTVTRLIIERAHFDDRDVAVPYPTGFHPSGAGTLKHWQDFVARRDRSSLFAFVGGARDWVGNDFRALLLRYCRSESPACRAVDCGGSRCAADAAAAVGAFLDSEFCLQPRG